MMALLLLGSPGPTTTFLKLKKKTLFSIYFQVLPYFEFSHFGFFTEDESVENMENRDIYTQDLFGLRSLQNKTQIYTIDGVYHHEWHQNISVIDNCIIPHLD